MYQRILLAYDGSQEGLIALREGALLAKRFGAHVFLLAIVPESHGARMAEGLTGHAVAYEIADYKALLARGVEVLTKLGLDPDARLVFGEPAPQIGAYASEIGADLIVLSHRRQNLIQRWWSGSTGAYISDNVRCSVLIGRNVISDAAFAAALERAAVVHSA